MRDMNKTGKTLLFRNREEWRSWLEKNHDKEAGIWMMYYKRHTRKESIPYNDAVEEALCYGWIDSTVRKCNEEQYMQRFTPRKAKSVWSELNKRRVEKMVREGKMTEAGLKKINEAKRNGYWNKLSEVNDTDKVPEDFDRALQSNIRASKFYDSLPPSSKKQYLWWISSAKREETRCKRVIESINLLSKGKKFGVAV